MYPPKSFMPAQEPNKVNGMNMSCRRKPTSKERELHPAPTVRSLLTPFRRRVNLIVVLLGGLATYVILFVQYHWPADSVLGESL
jgi:hypothetical protein